MYLSPDGTLIANCTVVNPVNSVTTIYQNGALVTAVPGVAVGWVDNSRLLVQSYATTVQGFITYANSTIYSPAGVALATPALPMLGNDASYAANLQTVSSDTIYDPKTNSIYSLTTGQAEWTGSRPGSGVGAVAGPNIVYESGNSLVAEPY